jgi:hypothetical protein
MKAPGLMMITAIGSLFLAYGLTACPPRSLPQVPDSSQDAAEVILDAAMPIDADAADSQDDGSSNIEAGHYPVCMAMCLNLAKHLCPEALGVDGGDSCYALCVHSEGTKQFNLKPACIVAAKTDADIRACGTVRCKKP